MAAAAFSWSSSLSSSPVELSTILDELPCKSLAAAAALAWSGVRCQCAAKNSAAVAPEPARRLPSTSPGGRGGLPVAGPRRRRRRRRRKEEVVPIDRNLDLRDILD